MFTLETIEIGSRRTCAIATRGGHLPLHQTLPELLARWDDAWPEILHRSADDSTTVHGGRVVPQLGGARKVICAGANYYDHLREMDVKLGKDASKPPFMFLKPPTALAGPGRTLPVDPSITQLDWEVEMAAVIGRGGRDLALAEALAHVAGYTVAVDVTARDRLFAPDSIFKFDFLAGKGQDGFCPTAFGLVPAPLFGDPQAARLSLALNGVTKQDASTSDMIYSVAEIVMWASRAMTLEPGDVILTGSPAGVGFPRREFMRAGDVMRVALAPHLQFDVELYARAERAK